MDCTQPEEPGNNNPQASTGRYLGSINCLIVVPDYRFFEKRQSIHLQPVCKSTVSRCHKFLQKIPSFSLKQNQKKKTQANKGQ